MHEIALEMLPDEHWYGFCVADGMQFPLHAESVYKRDIDPNKTTNQASPLLLSSKGRFICCGNGFTLTAANGLLAIVSRKSRICFSENHGNLRGAYLYAAQNFFTPSGKCPPDIFFTAPQYNTWIELLYNQNQSDILSYARSILDNGYPPGILMIDDGWMTDYGCWEFNPAKFPNPHKMIEALNSLGFRVMLWTCPFVSADGEVFRKLKSEGLLLRDASGGIAVRQWWNGYSAVLDFGNPGALDWYHRQKQSLMDRFGVSGFKFDAGDGMFYSDNDRSVSSIDANTQTMRWAEIGLSYPYNEYRAGFRLGGKPLVQRLADKEHSWDTNGLSSLIPNNLTQGILGYSYSCPDIIGGGEYKSFTANAQNLDEELFVRYAQCAALMPMMQYSAAPWRVLSREAAGLCRDAAMLHQKYAKEILALAKRAADTGEPITRYMEYQFPNQGLAGINDQFMLGERILVAPVLQKGQTVRSVYLPKGRWKYLIDGKTHTGGGVAEVNSPLDKLPHFVLEA